MPWHPLRLSHEIAEPAFSVDRFAVASSVCVLILRGQLDLHTAPALSSALDDLHADGDGHVVLDVSPLQFIDSTGLRILIACHQAVGQRLVLAEPQPFLSELLEIAGLADTLDVFPRLDDALAHVGVAEMV